MSISSSRIAASAAWMIGHTVVGRGINVVGQIILAWLLIPEDFGAYTLAITVLIFANMPQMLQISDVLVSRANRFRLYAHSAFYFSLLSGFVSLIVVTALAPLAGWIYEDAMVSHLLLIMAISLPMQSIAFVPRAKIQIQMRYKELAIILSLSEVIFMFLVILLAYLEFGAYSFAIGVLVRGILVPPVLLWASNYRPAFSFHVRRWRLMLGDLSYGYAMTLFQQVMHRGDYLVLGLFITNSAVGLYFMAFTLSTQTISLVLVASSNVLFSGLSLLSDQPARQTRAFIRALRALAFLAAPMCVWQAVTAEPLIHLVLDEKWYPTIPLIQILCLGMIMRAVGWPWLSIVKARRQFGFGAWWSIVTGMTFVAWVAVSAYLYGLIGAAAGVAIYFAVVYLVQMLVAVGEPKRYGGAILDCFLRAPVLAVASFGIVWVAWQYVATGLDAHAWYTSLSAIAIMTLLGGSIYIAISWIFNRSAMRDVFQQGRDMFIRKFSRRGSSVQEESLQANDF